ncbi:MAG: hypothetical protein IPJ77_10180 [Planctomycetes bacterium]|nr:hypothetical protein [Planctomycetota bacterium]
MILDLVLLAVSFVSDSRALLAQGEQPEGAATPTARTETHTWKKLATESYRGKQDDLCFLDARHGFYVNGAGKIFETKDGGATFALRLEQKGTYFRCIAFVDEQRGFAGNIGLDYFPGVTDATPLYGTTDGGATWKPVPMGEKPVKGLCALEVVRVPFVNAGKLDEKAVIVGGGRVGGPAVFVRSDDLGATWKRTELAQLAGMVLDVHFFDRQHGVIAAASNTEVQDSHARILRTEDGGETWVQAWEGPRAFELTWKLSFPTRDVGYCTIQSYDPDPKRTQRFIAKTVDGGKTWSELPLVDDAKVREFGVAFVDANTGWVGAMGGGFETRDGGATWARCELGNAVNKLRIVRDGEGWVGYALGVELWKLELTGKR